MELHSNKNSLSEGYLLHWYEIKRIIGRGGFGITYLARDNNLDRYVAIKEFMPEDFATRESDNTVHPKTGEQKQLYDWGLQRFVDEARTLAKFNHPNIVRVLSVFEENNTAYMVMEYAQGKDLSGIYRKSPRMDENQLLDIFIPIMDGLALVHNAGFIHRDIKPANIYICDNNSPLLLDFGSARQSIGGKTKALTSLVTFGYAPFEQYNEGSGKQGPWTDIYSLGASLYVGITGVKPVDAMNRGGSFLDTGIDTYEPASVIAKGQYSDNFLRAVDKALMFKIEDRPANILEWADMLLGKIQAPELPDYMLQTPVDDETVAMPWGDSELEPETAPSRGTQSGTQGLVDARGKRHSGRTDTVIKQPTQPSHRPQASGKPGFQAALPAIMQKKSSQLAALAGLGVLVLAIAMSWLLSGSDEPEPQPSPEQQARVEQKQIAEKMPDSGRSPQEKRIEQLLTRAEQASAIGDFVSPAGNNAAYFYQQILQLQADHAGALQGMENIEQELLNLARTAYIEKQYSQAQAYLQQLQTINPNLSQAGSLRQRLDTELNKGKLISDWLSQAEEHIRNNRYTSPADNNAYELYRKILNRQPDNQAAQQGVKKIQQYYRKLFKKHLKNRQLGRAERDLRIMKKIDLAESDISSMARKLKAAQKKQSRKAASGKKPVSKKLSIDQASQLIVRFKTAVQRRDRQALGKISEYTPGRRQFIKQLFSQYSTIDVKITDLRLISSKNMARAKVELKDLVDINGNKVLPGNWSKFEISLRYNEKNQLKVYW